MANKLKLTMRGTVLTEEEVERLGDELAKQVQQACAQFTEQHGGEVEMWVVLWALARMVAVTLSTIPDKNGRLEEARAFGQLAGVMLVDQVKFDEEIGCKPPEAMQ